MKTTSIKQGLSKIFSKSKESEPLLDILVEKNLNCETKLETDNKCFVDDNTIFAIKPKNDLIKSLIKNNFEVQEKDFPKLVFVMDEKEIKENRAGQEIQARFSTEYLKAILKICEGYDAVTIKLKRNYPISISTEDFECLIAPRVEPEDET